MIAEYDVSIERMTKGDPVTDVEYAVKIQKPVIFHIDPKTEKRYAKSITQRMNYPVSPAAQTSHMKTLNLTKQKFNRMLGNRWLVLFRGSRMDKEPFFQVNFHKEVGEWPVLEPERRRILELEDAAVLEQALKIFEPAFVEMLNMVPKNASLDLLEMVNRRWPERDATFMEGDELVLGEKMTRRDVEGVSFYDKSRVLQTTLAHRRRY
jgi:hypothetical protein